MIDYTNKFNFAIQFNLVLIFGVQTAVFLSLYIISTIKHTICNKLMQENLQCNKKQNWIIKIFWIYLYCSWIPHIVIKDQYGTFLLECYPNFSVFFFGSLWNGEILHQILRKFRPTLHWSFPDQKLFARETQSFFIFDNFHISNMIFYMILYQHFKTFYDFLRRT